MPDRRGFLSSLSAVAATAALPITKIYDDLAHQSLVPMPDAALYDKDEEAYWTAIRKQFLIAIKMRNDWHRTIRKIIRFGVTRRGTSFAIPWRRLWDASAMNLRWCETRQKQTATLRTAWT